MLTAKLFCFAKFRAPQPFFIITRAQQTDPVKQLFVDKIREYKQKSPSGQLVDPSPAVEKELKTELEKLEKHFGGGSGVDMNAFPTFTFTEPKLDPIDEPIPVAKEQKKP